MTQVGLAIRFDSKDLEVLKQYVRIKDIRNEKNRFLSPCQTIYSIVKSFVETEARELVDRALKGEEVEM